MHDIIVGVLRGGPSDEHPISLQSGHTVISHLPQERFSVRDIYIDRAGTWHERGFPTTPGKVLPNVDVAVVCVHGASGHDGEIQKVLAQFGVPYVGADPFHAFHASHKVMAKERAKQAGILTPRYSFAENEDAVDALARSAMRFLQPVVVKPADGGSSLGVAVVTGYQSVVDAARALLAAGARGVLVEERIRGTEASVAVVEGLRGEELYACPPVEIVPPDGEDHFSFKVKYDGSTLQRCPGRFKRDVSTELMDAARTLHRALGQRHYSRSDFIVSDKGIYFLELNTAAAVGLTRESILPRSLASVGVTLPDFLSHVVSLAHSERRR